MSTNEDKPTDAGSTAGQQPASADVAPRPETDQEPSFDFWRTAHRALRGRYRLALLIAAGGAAIGAGAGAMLGQRLYSATGLVRIASSLPPVMRQTDQNRPMEMFDGVIAAQRDVMTSREIIEAAMKEQSWKKAGRAASGMSGEQFAASLKVETRPRSDHLRVTFTSPDPGIAAAAVRSIINAYQQEFTREQGRVEGQRMGQIQTRHATLSAELQKLESEMAVVADGHAAAEIDPLYVASVERVKKLRSALSDVQCTLAGGPDLSRQGGSAGRVPSEIVADEFLRSAIAEQIRVDNLLLDARSKGFGPGHPVIKRLEAAAEECRARLARCMTACSATEEDGTPGELAKALTQREASLREAANAAEVEMNRLAEQRTRLGALETQAAAARQSLAETDSRIDALTTEAAVGSRLTVISEGDKPMTALRDSRAKTAGFGAMAGMMAPLGGFVLAGMFKRRYRFCDEVATDLVERVPFVSVLPNVIDDAATINGLAAHCLHDLRIVLQPPKNAPQRTYLVTSVAAGEGRSGLTVALGLSFAAAGYRTLIVDCDLQTRGLTRGFDVNDSRGMVEAAAGSEPLTWRLRAGSSLLAAGQCSRVEMYNLSPAAIGRVLAAVRGRFDVVLIDSDPILTGITSSVVAPQVDGVLLAMQRNQESKLVHAALRRLATLGGHVAGAVFNKADLSDFRAAMKDLPQASAASERAMPERLRRFGPLACAMLSSLSFTREEDLELLPAGSAATAVSGESQRAIA